MRFVVQTPSKADLLFVIDNSGSMLSKQETLANAVGQLIDSLAPQDTRYRIGITSTDAHGFLQDCNNNDNPPVASNNMGDQAMGAKGNYCSGTYPNAALRRPHDATLGRLIAAYDSKSFDPNAYDLADNPNAFAALKRLMPTGVSTSADANLLLGEAGARWVIDREVITTESCNACGCTVCKSGDSCYDDCANPVARARVQSYFLANIRGLGNQGFGWEEGLKSAMWAIGINPEESDDASALAPSYNITADNGPNTFLNVSDAGALQQTSWLREDAMLAMLFLSDEQDCSMPKVLMDNRSTYETDPPPNGSICYQAKAQAQFHDPNRLIQLTSTLKGVSTSRVAVGLIGGVAPKQSSSSVLDSAGTATDCVLTDAQVPNTQCSCSTTLSQESGTGATNDLSWCDYTTLHQTSGLASCDALSASRYVAFAYGFNRRTFESICRQDENAYGPAMANFARIATQACFDLLGVQPTLKEGAYVTVQRTPQGSEDAPVELTRQPSDSLEAGFYYDAQNNRVCLTGLDRLIGDTYDIFVQQADYTDYRE